ncbi:TPA: 16S rRNA (guanine(527)-N(7))-methyltransferase RsmG [Candidatus Spyradomonas excrementavium]|nr:16S rRNA (guanine(527)-N(7))-methyltransferase RsmG [Candidatus Spyradomonas excrementavium]
MKTELLEKLGLNVTKTAQTRLDDFLMVFKSYNSHTNLVSRHDMEFFFEKHIYDSLAMNLFLKKYGLEKFKMLDIGTGGGFPAVPVAIFYDSCPILAIDSVSKKIGFVEIAQKLLQLENLTPASKRAEDLHESDKESFDIVTSRAVAQLNTLLEYGVPYLRVGGYFVAYKAQTAEQEIENAKRALDVLNAKVVDIIEYSLPNLEEHTRKLIIIQKTGKTPAQYPRKSGIAKKSPL